jgi:hypothetical protein
MNLNTSDHGFYPFQYLDFYNYFTYLKPHNYLS